MGQHLHEAAARVLDEGAGVAAHDAFAGLHGDALGLGLRLGEAHHGDLGPAVDAAGHDAHVHPVLQAAEQLRKGLTLGGGHMGQLGLGGHVPDGVDGGDAGLVAPVHLQDAAVQLGLEPLGEEALPGGPAAYGAQHRLAGDGVGLAPGAEADPQALLARLHPLHQGVGADAHVLLFQNQRQVLAQLPVQHGQQPVQPFQDGDLTAQVGEEAGKLDADDPAADDHQGAVETVRALQQLLAGEHPGQLHPGQGQAHGRGTGGDQDALGGNYRKLSVGGADLHPVGRQDPGTAPQQGDLCAFEHALHSLGQGLGHPELVLKDLSQVRPQSLGVDAHRGALQGGAIEGRAVEQGLGGDAASVHTGAARFPGLHHGGLLPQLGRPQGRGLAAGAGADHQKFKVVHISS